MKLYDLILFAIAYVLFVSSDRVSAERLSMSQVASVWKSNGGSSSSCPVAVAVAWAESRGDTRARGQNSNSYDRGLWQINSYWHRDVSDSCAYDKNCNARNAVRISSNGGNWRPWATYNDGLHNRFLSDARRACGGSYDELDAPVGGFRAYGEYNKGPYKAGVEWNNNDEADVSAQVQDTLVGFDVFDKKWHKYTKFQTIENLPNTRRRLRLSKGRKLNILGAFDALMGSVQGATSAVQGVLNLFGKQSSEALVGQFQDRGFSDFNEATTITVTGGLPTKYYTAFITDMLKDVVKVPSKHKDAVKQIVRWGLHTQSNTWNAAENVFDIGKGGNVKNFQLFINRNIACEEMNIVLIKTDVTFKLAPDLFVISKSKASWGGAFSETKLHWKKEKKPIRAADLQFVSEYFITLGMNRIKQSREVAGFAQTDDGSCGSAAPPPQENPFGGGRGGGGKGKNKRKNKNKRKRRL